MEFKSLEGISPIYILKLGQNRISILNIKKKKKKKSYLLYFLESNMAHVRKFCQQKMNINNQIFVFKYWRCDKI